MSAQIITSRESCLCLYMYNWTYQLSFACRYQGYNHTGLCHVHRSQCLRHYHSHRLAQIAECLTSWEPESGFVRKVFWEYIHFLSSPTLCMCLQMCPCLKSRQVQSITLRQSKLHSGIGQCGMQPEPAVHWSENILTVYCCRPSWDCTSYDELLMTYDMYMFIITAMLGLIDM